MLYPIPTHPPTLPIRARVNSNLNFKYNYNFNYYFQLDLSLAQPSPSLFWNNGINSGSSGWLIHKYQSYFNFLHHHKRKDNLIWHAICQDWLFSKYFLVFIFSCGKQLKKGKCHLIVCLLICLLAFLFLVWSFTLKVHLWNGGKILNLYLIKIKTNST